METVCPVHENHIETIQEMANDLKWLKRLGVWAVSLAGGVLVVIVPLIVSLFVWLSSVDTRITVLERQIVMYHPELKH